MPRDRALALNAALPSQINAITPIAGGASGAFPFRVEIAGRNYVVRVEGPASPLRNPHQYVSMQIASEAGIAPKIYYVDEAARVSVMDLLRRNHSAPFRADPVRWRKRRERCCAVCKQRLHSRNSLNIRISLAAYGLGYAKQVCLRPVCWTRTPSA